MPNRRTTKYIVLHCSATRAKQDVDAAQIRQWHLAQGWQDIGYHYVIKRDGTVETGRAPDNSVGSHVKDHNSNTLGICLVGGLNNETARPEDNFSGEQKAALRQLITKLLVRYPDATILGHRDLSPDKNHNGTIERNEWLKECPCFDARAWARSTGLPAAPERLA
jgi:N-acetylmuramoyl-L-alanine amidase